MAINNAQTSSPQYQPVAQQTNNQYPIPQSQPIRHHMIDMSQNPNPQNGNVHAVHQPEGQFGSLMCLSILSCFFCFCPTGIVAIFYAFRGRDRFNTGAYDQAERDRKKAQLWVKITVVVGIIWTIFWYWPK